MSTHPESRRTDDEAVALLSQWLNDALGNDELRRRLAELPADELAPAQRDALGELGSALANAFPGERGELETLVRDTAESLVYGG